jgi:hypothetical protein
MDFPVEVKLEVLKQAYGMVSLFPDRPANLVEATKANYRELISLLSERAPETQQPD